MNAQLRTAIIALDRLLTGKTDAEIEHTARNQPAFFADPLNFLFREYYLSDGGYSRIVLNDEAKLRLTSNSLDRAKERWASAEAQKLASEIESLFAELIRAAEEAQKS